MTYGFRVLAKLFLILFLISTFARVSPVRAETIARCGQGWLESIDGYAVLHLRGTPYEMGYQHGALMKEHCRSNVDYLIHRKGGELVEVGPLKLSPRAAIDGILAVQRRHVPAYFFEEMDGLAAGAGLDKNDIYAANFIPELFHCSGFAVMGSATRDGTLYHGRVLDYAIDWRLQEHAVLIVAEPEGGIPFVNVTYAGFIGSVTGMNAQHVAIGEMGGGGLGHWDGVPMAVLVREVLQSAPDLDAAVAIFRDRPRTCEYYYVVSDGKTNRAVGLATSWQKMDTVAPGEAHAELPHPVADAVLLSAGERYEELVRRVKREHGRIDSERAIRLMDRPVAMKSNLHNALFAPATTDLWVANATKELAPAADQRYFHFRLSELLSRTPDPDAPVLPLVGKSAE